MEYFQNMDVNKVSDNKMFWKTVKPRFSNKCKTVNTIILTENNEKLIAGTFNNYFADITKILMVIQILMASLYLALLITSKTMKV